MKKAFLFFLVFTTSILASNVLAKGDSACYWFKDYDYGLLNQLDASDVSFILNGDIVVTGSTNSFGARKLDAWVMKVSKCGKIFWLKSYGGSEDDISSSLAIAKNGDIIIGGWTGSFIKDGDWDLWLLRLDENGSIVWQKDYGGSIDDGYTPVSLSVAPNGDIVVATSLLAKDGYENIWILRLDKNGNVKWSKTYGIEYEDDYSNSVSIAPNGDIIVAGVTWGSYKAGDNYISGAWVLRLDSDGNTKWQKVYGNSYALELANGLVVDRNGNIIVSGSTGSLSENMYGWITYLDENGGVKWSKSYSHKENGNIRELTLAPNGDIIGRDDYILRISPNGSLEWAKWMIDGEMVGPKILPNGITAIAGGESHSFAVGLFNISKVPTYSGWNNPNDPGWNGWGDVNLKTSDVSLIVADSDISPKPFSIPVNDISMDVHDIDAEFKTNTVWYSCSLTAPQDLKAVVGEANITLSWNPPSDDGGCNIIEYKIYRGTSSGNEAYYTSVKGSTTSYTDNNLVAKQTYYYKVSAVNGVREGPKSNEVVASVSKTSGGTSSSSSETTGSGKTNIQTSERGSNHPNILIPSLIIVVLLVLGVLGYMLYGGRL